MERSDPRRCPPAGRRGTSDNGHDGNSLFLLVQTCHPYPCRASPGGVPLQAPGFPLSHGVSLSPHDLVEFTLRPSVARIALLFLSQFFHIDNVACRVIRDGVARFLLTLREFVWSRHDFP